MKRLLVSRFEELAAYALMGLALFAGFALLSWQAGDPSGSVTQLTPPTNWLGQRGASFANFNMQLFGLVALPLYATLGFLGYEAWRKQSFEQLSKRWLPFGFMVALGSLAFACLPSFGTWPLSVSFGGGLGDSLLRLIAHVTGELSAFGKFFLLLPTALFAYKALIGAWTRQEKKRASSSASALQDEYDASQEPSLFGLFIDYFKFKKRGLKDRLAQNTVKAEPRLTPRPSLPDFLVPEFNPAPVERQFQQPAAHGFEQPVAQPRQEVNFEDFAPSPAPRSLSMRPETMQAAPSAPSFLEREQPTPAQRPRFQGFDPRQDYEFPSLEIMADVKPSERHPSMSMETLQENARMLEGVLDDFGVRGEIINVRPGPVVTLYELEPAAGVKSSRVIGLADDIARSMSAISARVAVVPGRNAIGIELPNARRQNVLLREMLASKEFTQSRDKLPIALGKTIGGDPVIVDLAKMPHLLVAGTTGSGKSVAINTMILSLLYRLKPEECRLIMVDPKMLELSIYDGIPHLLTPVVTDPKKAVVALKWAVREMEERYKKMSKVGVRNIDGFNQRIKEAALKGETITRTVQTGFDRETGEAIYEQEEMDLVALPYIVVIVDEMADLMMVAGKEIEGLIQRLAQMARAAGIHIITATQRPSVDVITGTIKANFPTRISFQVTSKIDSRTILGEMGAEQLLGRGDMLYMAGGGRISRVHGPFVADDEVEAVVAHLKTQGTPEYLETVLAEEEADEKDDKPVMDKGDYSRLKNDVEEPTDLYEKAVQIVLRDAKCSTSYVQRRLGVGYNKAATLVERMEKEGLVGPSNPTGKREILVETQER